jgi:hypothetical protein
MSAELELSPVFQWFISGIGSLGIFLLNSMRSEQRKTNDEIEKTNNKLSKHLEDRKLHALCGKEHE